MHRLLIIDINLLFFTFSILTWLYWYYYIILLSYLIILIWLC